MISSDDMNELRKVKNIGTMARSDIEHAMTSPIAVRMVFLIFLCFSAVVLLFLSLAKNASRSSSVISSKYDFGCTVSCAYAWGTSTKKRMGLRMWKSPSTEPNLCSLWKKIQKKGKRLGGGQINAVQRSARTV